MAGAHLLVRYIQTAPNEEAFVVWLFTDKEKAMPGSLEARMASMQVFCALLTEQAQALQPQVTSCSLSVKRQTKNVSWFGDVCRYRIKRVAPATTCSCECYIVW